MIYFLTAVGLTPGGSNTVHIYTQTVHRKTQSTQKIYKTTQYGGRCAVPYGQMAEYNQANICFCNCFSNTIKYGFCCNLYWHGVFYSSEEVGIIESSYSLYCH
jgi:hypothetical protein